MRPTTMAPAQPLNCSLPWAALWENESASLAGLIKKYGERRGAWPAMANAPVSPVYPDALGLAGTVVSPTQMRRKSIPWALTRKDEGALPVAGAALATAKGTSGVRPAGGAKKSTAATSEA